MSNYYKSSCCDQQVNFIRTSSGENSGYFVCQLCGKECEVTAMIDTPGGVPKEEPAYIGGVNLTTNDNEISNRLAVTDRNIGMLRQWLNEKDPERMVTNQDIKDWLNIK
jgi:hypothetical protein